MLRRDSPTPREHMSERLWMRDRMALLHSVCHHHEFVKTSHRGSHETCSPQVLPEPSMAEMLREEQLHEERDLERGLKSRHIQMIAIGGAIGVGLFLGSARAIQAAGPALLLSYAFVGMVIFFIMRALGELLMYRPVAGSFATYAEEFIGPWAGFFTGWSYLFMWVVTGMAEITAVAVYVNYWFPEVPHWIPALVTLAVLYG